MHKPPASDHRLFLPFLRHHSPAAASAPEGTLILGINRGPKNQLQYESLAKNIGYPGVAWKLMPSSSHILNLCMQIRCVACKSASLGAWRRVARQGKACCAKRVGVSDTAGASASPAEWREADRKLSLQCASEQCEMLRCRRTVRFPCKGYTRQSQNMQGSHFSPQHHAHAKQWLSPLLSRRLP